MQQMVCSQQNTESPAQRAGTTSLPFQDPHPLCVQGPGAETWASEDRPWERADVGCMETAWRGWTKGHTQKKPGPSTEVKWHVRGGWALPEQPLSQCASSSCGVSSRSSGSVRVPSMQVWLKPKLIPGATWLRKRGRDLCPLPGQGNKIPHATQHDQEKKKKKSYLWQTHHQPNTGIWNRSRDAHSYHFYSTYIINHSHSNQTRKRNKMHPNWKGRINSYFMHGT